MLHGGAGSSPVRSIHLVETHAGILASELRRRLAQVSHTPSSQVLKLTHPYLYLLRSRKPALQMQYPQSRRHSRRCRPLMMHPRPLTALIKEQVSLPSVYESPMGENIDDSPGKEMILRSLTGCVSQRPSDLSEFKLLIDFLCRMMLCIRILVLMSVGTCVCFVQEHRLYQ